MCPVPANGKGLASLFILQNINLKTIQKRVRGVLVFYLPFIQFDSVAMPFGKIAGNTYKLNRNSPYAFAVTLLLDKIFFLFKTISKIVPLAMSNSRFRALVPTDDLHTCIVHVLTQTYCIYLEEEVVVKTEYRGFHAIFLPFTLVWLFVKTAGSTSIKLSPV
ncbi:hypothetical protein M2132_000492 [Dysgonomonas sp. PH5-45]|uniref:hypothetical protein n=1 Tax=unclassified Dysgonomonas TaxID=2630389 RepID=UPI002473FD15|nr:MULTISPECIES: hypothetical protein [unclassified Dysgonomonas]MDH6354170.1 hypothetical protein [Dysgonomonas sp. PH5-45]MDH6386979.1 hypothetical protein [Dysgonomonas sp. PH5-37]